VDAPYGRPPGDGVIAITGFRFYGSLYAWRVSECVNSTWQHVEKTPQDLRGRCRSPDITVALQLVLQAERVPYECETKR
jgi:hypothetical protein